MASALAAGVERAFESDLLGIAATPSSLRPSAPHLRTQLAAQLGERTFRQIHEKIREAVRDESRDEDERCLGLPRTRRGPHSHSARST